MASNLSRRRGAILTATGESKLQAARETSEQQHNFGDRYTKEQLSAMLGLSYKTVAKIFGGGFAVTGNRVPVDKQTLDLCFAAFDLTLEPQDYIYPDRDLTPPEIDPVIPHQTCDLNPALDCGEAPDVTDFYGRETELAQLESWVTIDRCRSIGILGMGGIGKTALVTKLARQIHPDFAAVAWRSLRNAPPLPTLLPKLIEIFSERVEIVPPTMDISTQITCLLHYFREKRCLLILDNVETILRAELAAQPDYSGYSELFQRIGASQHQSCLLLTSREKPEAIVSLEGEKLPVRTLVLHGLDVRDGERLFDAKGLSVSSTSRSRLVENYSGNPLALNIVATTINDLFDGDIDRFLATEVTIFSDIRQLLDRQFERLSHIEQTVMYWLAIDREWVSLATLERDLLPAASMLAVLETVESLSRKSLVEHQGGKFTQQAVVMEYTAVRCIERVVSDLIDWNANRDLDSQLPLWLSHVLLKAESPEYIHAIQTRLILEPIVKSLQAKFTCKAALVSHLKSILADLQTPRWQLHHYGGGNLIALFRYLQVDLSGYDFSNLPIWQANLQGATLHDVNFSGADLSKSLFTQNFGGIYALDFSPDNRLMVMGEYRGDLLLWQIDRQQLLHRLTGHTNWIWSIAFSPDGLQLASASQDSTVRLWDVATGKVQHVLQVDSYHVLSLCYRPIDPSHPDRDFSLATAHGDGTIRLWNTRTGDIMRQFAAHPKQAFSVRFSPDGRLLATGSDDPTVKIWDVSTGECIQTLAHHTRRVWSVRFSPDGKLLATCSGDGTIALWAVPTPQDRGAEWSVIRVLTGYRDWIYAVCFSPDSRLLATGSSGNIVQIWDLQANEKICILQGHTTWVSALQFSPDGKLLITGSGDRSVRQWDTLTWKELYRWQGYTNWIESVAFDPTGTKLLSGGQDGIVKVWNVSTGKTIQTLTGHQQGLWAVDFSPDGRSIASSSADSTVKLWDAHTGELEHTLSIERGDAWRVTFSPDNRLVAGIGMDNLIVYIWSRTGELRTTLVGHTNVVRSIAFSPNSQLLATGSFDACWRLWDLATERVLGCYEGHTNWIWEVAFSPNGRLLATASADRTARSWDVATGELLQVFAGHTQEVVSVKFSPNGQHLATSSGDRSIKIWEIETGELIETLTGHLDRVLALSYSPDGRLLASGSADETIKFWDLDTGTCTRTCKPPPPYQGMNITGVTGLTPATITSLKTLGAIENLP